MSFTPVYVGATHEVVSFTCVDDSGVAISITGATIVARFSSLTAARAAFNGTGTITITDGPNGKATYQFSADDLSVASAYLLQFTATYGDGTVLPFDAENFEVLARV